MHNDDQRRRACPGAQHPDSCWDRIKMVKRSILPTARCRSGQAFFAARDGDVCETSCSSSNNKQHVILVSGFQFNNIWRGSRPTTLGQAPRTVSVSARSLSLALSRALSSHTHTLSGWMWGAERKQLVGAAVEAVLADAVGQRPVGPSSTSSSVVVGRQTESIAQQAWMMSCANGAPLGGPTRAARCAWPIAVGCC
jgi:hypothetical protein